MKKKWKWIFGIFFLVKSLLFLVMGYYMNMTGNVVIDSVYHTDLKFVFGLIFMLIGLMFINIREGALPKKERNDIKVAFKNWEGTNINKNQRDIFKKYGLRYERGNKHPQIYDGEYLVTGVSLTSSDRRSGRNLASFIIKYLEEKN